jgi:hypothetical protein
MALNLSGTTGIVTSNIADAQVTSGKLASGAARANFGAGAVLQVVQGVQSNVLNNLQSTSMADITGLTASITPSSTSNKILVTVSMFGGSNSNCTVRLLRDSTAIGLNTNSPVGNRKQGFGDFYSNQQNTGSTINFTYLDSPASVASLTYKIQYAVYSTSTFCLNANYLDADAAYVTRSISTITLTEIAG